MASSYQVSRNSAQEHVIIIIITTMLRAGGTPSSVHCSSNTHPTPQLGLRRVRGLRCNLHVIIFYFLPPLKRQKGALPGGNAAKKRRLLYSIVGDTTQPSL